MREGRDQTEKKMHAPSNLSVHASNTTGLFIRNLPTTLTVTLTVATS